MALEFPGDGANPISLQTDKVVTNTEQSTSGSDHREAAPHPEKVTVIEPEDGRVFPSLDELRPFRELFLRLLWRDLKLRYHSTLLGIVWVVLLPLSQMLVLTVVFGIVARVPTGGIPYPVFVFAGLVPFSFFSKVTSDGANSLRRNLALVKKVYFPRIIVPFASVVSGLVDMAITTVFLMTMVVVIYGISITSRVLVVPLLLMIPFVLAFGTALWFAALNVRYRDASLILPTILQLSMYLSPIIYPAALVPKQWLWLYGLNPLAGVVEGMRWALFGNSVADTAMLASAVVISLTVCVSGAAYFRKVERVMPDVM